MKTLLLRICLNCHKVYGYKWTTNFELNDIVVRNGVKFGIAISHGLCEECFKEWQKDFEKRRKHKKGGG